ncbi:hypothetical protein HBI56_182340 [Parastagonospora nodorum]|uniref:Uncharacterized protein n=1 Tax=Phaeosphaeria nodorum (strain SN15 / ATCC MYA-4574 / FGSC 10173) TaxID=321614 RepID=A0A7U2F9K8_PHANO|nr:hypothetical protein HBH56_187750 [Parastagonospora nodorum]QRD00943.1 hypothetical protein JI435_164780 [Parastagonospora nodorum SN15]KAH3953252.1 hypothetical protein HBH53_035200 [Parastagonospora nodorum]KAH3959160.1 hypothetical protein HBH52_246270 [Parastagonospora nodorum]KAH3984749.1 hypothetical protein HBH51_025330 [Parastagonospora nodorum]
MTFYHDNTLTMMGLDSSPLDFLYAPSSSKRTYSEMSQASSSSSGELQQVNAFQGGSGETYHLGNSQGGVPSNEDVSLPANYEHEIPGLDSAANEATDDTTDIAPGASANTGAEYGPAAGEGARTICKQEEEETQGTEKNLIPKKRPTRFIGTQTLMVVLKRAYIDADRARLAFPHNLTNAQRVNEGIQQVNEAAQQVHEVAQQANETAQQATATFPVSPIGTLNRGFLQATGGFAFQPSLGYPMVATNATTGAFYHDPQPQTSPGTGPFDQPFRMPIAPAQLGTVYEENEDENLMHGLPMSPTPNVFGAARRHRRNAPSILNMASLSGATVPSNASYSAPATPFMFGGRIKLGDQNVVWGKGIVDESGIINADHAIPVPNYKGTSHMIGFNNEFRRDGPGGGGNGISDNANSPGSNSHGGGMVH